MPATDPQNLPWRYWDDAYYQKGAFNIQFEVAPEGPVGTLDPAARRRALQQLILALRKETGLKISAYVDVLDDERETIAETEIEESSEYEDPEHEVARAEFAVYNKLGATSLGKLRRFMDEYLLGDIDPRILLVDPETGAKFRATDFTIRYLFHEFVAHREPDSWDRLKELMKSPDRGYSELMRPFRSARFKTHLGRKMKKQSKAVFTPEDAYQVGEAIGINWDEVEFDSADLAAGMEVELEHGSMLGEKVDVTGDDPELTAKIAWAHLIESPDYYDALAVMEKELEKKDEKQARVASFVYEEKHIPAVGDRVVDMQLSQTNERFGVATLLFTSGKDILVGLTYPGHRTGYTRSISTERYQAPRNSPALQKYVKDYLGNVVDVVDRGEAADTVFSKMKPDLDSLSADDLLTLLWENKHVGDRTIGKMHDVFKYGDIYTLIQAVLERYIWEQAVTWWGNQETKPQEHLPASDESEETVLLKKPKAARVRSTVKTQAEVVRNTWRNRYRGTYYDEATDGRSRR